MWHADQSPRIEPPLPEKIDGDIPPPTISTTEWAGVLPANDYTLRAAIVTCVDKPVSQMRLFRVDSRILDAYRHKKGWLLDLAYLGGFRDRRAVRPGTRHATEPLRLSPFNAFSGRWEGAFFDELETERIMRAFLRYSPPPDFMRWARVEWRSLYWTPIPHLGPVQRN